MSNVEFAAAYQARRERLKEGLSKFPSHCILSAMMRRYMVLRGIEVDCGTCRRYEECQGRLLRQNTFDSE